MNIKINDIHCHYEGQTECQDAYLEFDPENNTITADYNAEIGNAVPAKVWHGQIIRWEINPCLKYEAIELLIKRITPLLETVRDGHEVVWDGNNHKGRLSEEAFDASNEISQICKDMDDEYDCIKYWEPDDWYANIGSHKSQAEFLGITCNTSDEEMEEVIANERVAAQDQDAIIESLDDYLYGLRDDVRA